MQLVCLTLKLFVIACAGHYKHSCHWKPILQPPVLMCGVFGRLLAGSPCPNPTGMGVCLCECCLLSGRGPCGELIPRPEQSCEVWFVWVWSWNLANEEDLAHWGLLLHGMPLKSKQFCVLLFLKQSAVSLATDICQCQWFTIRSLSSRRHDNCQREYSGEKLRPTIEKV